MKAGLLLVGFLFIVNGILALKRRRYGPEEGIRGILIKGKAAIFFGIVLTMIGLVLIAAGLILNYQK